MRSSNNDYVAARKAILSGHVNGWSYKSWCIHVKMT